MERLGHISRTEAILLSFIFPPGHLSAFSLAHAISASALREAANAGPSDIMSLDSASVSVAFSQNVV